MHKFKKQLKNIAVHIVDHVVIAVFSLPARGDCPSGLTEAQKQLKSIYTQ